MPESDRPNKPKVLLVEDEFLVAIATQQLLQNLGFDVIGPARKVDEACGLIAGHSDLLVTVLDVQLANEKVWPVARELRDRGVPFLFVTGDIAIQDQLPNDLKNAKFLVKPFDERRLRETIESILGEGGKAQWNDWSAVLGPMVLMASAL